jgi:hypothetical protein
MFNEHWSMGVARAVLSRINHGTLTNMVATIGSIDVTEQARRASERSYAALAELLPRIGAFLAGTNAQQAVADLKRDYKRTVEEFLSAASMLNDRLWLAYAGLIAYRSLVGQGFRTIEDAVKNSDEQRALEWALDEVCWPHVIDRSRLESEVSARDAGTAGPSVELESAINGLEWFLVGQLPVIQVGLAILSESELKKEFPLAVKLHPQYEQLNKRLTHEKAAVEKLGALLS